MATLKLKHLVAIRWFHWINFPLLALMIWSGFLIYWAYPIYSVGPVRFPQSLFQLLHMNHRLADGMAMHFFFMWLFVINGILYVGYTILSGEWRLLVPRSLETFRDAWYVALCDLHLRKERPVQDKYNAAQQVSYTAIIVMGIGSVLSGLAIYKPAQLSWLAMLFGGYPGARLCHFLLTVGYCAFFVVHVVQVILAGWNNFRAMVIGYELVEEHE
jgi:thiosulfate reductase cytochrome b subunit